MKQFFLLLLLTLLSCKEGTFLPPPPPQPLPAPSVIRSLDIASIPAMNKDSSINVLIEITAGMTAKWEYDKQRKAMRMDSVAGIPHHINYLGYPANYGMIPNTLSSKENGGDGDPLDVIVLGKPLPRSSIQKCKVLAVLKLKDRGETDDKLIAAHVDSAFARFESLEELKLRFPGALEIIETWFLNYKGLNAAGKPLVQSEGYRGRVEAMRLLGGSVDDN